MKIGVDENIPTITVQSLRNLKHDVLDIRGTTEEGMSDEQLWLRVQSDQRLLVTTDKGFVQYRNQTHYGILIVRLRQPNEQKIHQRVMQTIMHYPESEWPGLVVVMRDTIQSVWRAV